MNAMAMLKTLIKSSYFEFKLMCETDKKLKRFSMARSPHDNISYIFNLPFMPLFLDCIAYYGLGSGFVICLNKTKGAAAIFLAVIAVLALLNQLTTAHL